MQELLSHRMRKLYNEGIRQWTVTYLLYAGTAEPQSAEAIKRRYSSVLQQLRVIVAYLLYAGTAEPQSAEAI
jgi:hypothetical protein